MKRPVYHQNRRCCAGSDILPVLGRRHTVLPAGGKLPAAALLFVPHARLHPAMFFLLNSEALRAGASFFVKNFQKPIDRRLSRWYTEYTETVL